VTSLLELRSLPGWGEAGPKGDALRAQAPKLESTNFATIYGLPNRRVIANSQLKDPHWIAPCPGEVQHLLRILQAEDSKVAVGSTRAVPAVILTPWARFWDDRTAYAAALGFTPHKRRACTLCPGKHVEPFCTRQRTTLRALLPVGPSRPHCACLWQRPRLAVYPNRSFKCISCGRSDTEIETYLRTKPQPAPVTPAAGPSGSVAAADHAVVPKRERCPSPVRIVAPAVPIAPAAPAALATLRAPSAREVVQPEAIRASPVQPAPSSVSPSTGAPIAAPPSTTVGPSAAIQAEPSHASSPAGTPIAKPPSVPHIVVDACGFALDDEGSQRCEICGWVGEHSSRCMAASASNTRPVEEPAPANADQLDVVPSGEATTALEATPAEGALPPSGPTAATAGAEARPASESAGEDAVPVPAEDTAAAVDASPADQASPGDAIADEEPPTEALSPEEVALAEAAVLAELELAMSDADEEPTGATCLSDAPPPGNAIPTIEAATSIDQHPVSFPDASPETSTEAIASTVVVPPPQEQEPSPEQKSSQSLVETEEEPPLVAALEVQESQVITEAGVEPTHVASASPGAEDALIPTSEPETAEHHAKAAVAIDTAQGLQENTVPKPAAVSSPRPEGAHGAPLGVKASIAAPAEERCVASEPSEPTEPTDLGSPSSSEAAWVIVEAELAPEPEPAPLAKLVVAAEPTKPADNTTTSLVSGTKCYSCGHIGHAPDCRYLALVQRIGVGVGPSPSPGSNSPAPASTPDDPALAAEVAPTASTDSPPSATEPNLAEEPTAARATTPSASSPPSSDPIRTPSPEADGAAVANPAGVTPRVQIELVTPSSRQTVLGKRPADGEDGSPSKRPREE
jgi:hypothetical protein